ncbi:AHH domain-containing protein [Bacillus pseudomycoides]|uniref:AHH domain-containing protein n=1 Tax=Bacillus pseudomycoides TaxID=64104 RepID=UPI00211D2A9A|nr:AHH domain-containing protein [Bacillus pseudomycoides]
MNAGVSRPPKHEAHHIIPYNQGRLRKYIEKYGIDGNSAANRVFQPQNYHPNWPGQVTHSVWNNMDEKGNMMFRHGREYIDYLEKKLKEIDKLDVRILSKADKKQEILSFLEEMWEGLLTGKIQFLYKD